MLVLEPPSSLYIRPDVLEKDVGDEEDAHGQLKLGSCEAKLLLQAVKASTPNVDSIEERLLLKCISIVISEPGKKQEWSVQTDRET